MAAREERQRSGQGSKKQFRLAVNIACRGMELRHFAWLARPEGLLENFYVLTDFPLAAKTADTTFKVPWAVALLLGSHSRNHVFVSNKSLDPRTLRDPLRDMTNRIKLLWHFRDNDGPQGEKPLLRRKVCPHNSWVPPEIKKFGKFLSNTVRDHFGDKLEDGERLPLFQVPRVCT